MADQENLADGSEAIQVNTNILAQFVRDMSFENIIAQKGNDAAEIQPEIQVAVNLDVRKREQENQFEVVHKLRIKSKNKVNEQAIFIFEIDYVGIFQIEGVPEDQLHPYLLIECPRLLFPFLRRIVADVTRDGGLPPFNLDMINYLALYQQELARQQEKNSPVN